MILVSKKNEFLNDLLVFSEVLLEFFSESPKKPAIIYLYRFDWVTHGHRSDEKGVVIEWP